MPQPSERIAVIGAGTAGRDFALRCAAAGFQVALEDVMPEKLRQAQADFTDLAVPIYSTGSLRVASTVEDAVTDADFVIDFVPDELESKLEILSLLDRMAPPRTILCTPTEALSITDLASCTYRPDRCIGLQDNMHVIVRGECTSTASLATVESLLHRLGIHTTTIHDAVKPMLVKNFR